MTRKQIEDLKDEAKAAYDLTETHLRFLSNALLKGIAVKTHEYKEIHSEGGLEYKRVRRVGFVNWLDGEIMEETLAVLVDSEEIDRCLFYLSPRQVEAFEKLTRRKKPRQLWYKQITKKGTTLRANPKTTPRDRETMIAVICHLLLEGSRVRFLTEDEQTKALGE